MDEDVDVLVVGGGPAGLATAQRIAAQGHRVLVVHRDRKIGEPVRTSGASWERDMQDLGIPSHLYRPMQSIAFAGPSRRHVMASSSNRLVILDVTQTYLYLAGLAQQSGASIKCATSFEKIVGRSDDGMVCSVSNEGRSYRVSARYVVDASGYKQAVLNDLGLPGKHRRFGVGIEGEFVNQGDATQATLFVGTEFTPTGYGWIFPTPSGTVRVGVGITQPDMRVAPKALFENFLQSKMTSRLNLKIGDEIERHHGVIPSASPAESFIHGNCISVGDSAGQALATVGEGIRFSIESGRQAGAAIAGALAAPNHPARHLARYSTWWNDKYRRSFSCAYRANCRMSNYDDKKWDAAIDMLSVMDSNDLAALLRAEFSAKNVLKTLLRSPIPSTYHLSKRILRRISNLHLNSRP